MAKRRVPPRAISKRLRRKLARSSNPFLLWLRLRRTPVYERLERWWAHQFWKKLLGIDPWQTPFFSLAPKTNAQQTLSDWAVDALE